MKEKSVEYYKNLIKIIFTLSVITILILVIIFVISRQKNDNEQHENKSSKSIYVGTEDIGEGKKIDENTSGKVSKTKSVIDVIEASGESEKRVYLTFEDSPSRNTEQILEVLNKNKVKGTFFFNTSKKYIDEITMKKVSESGNEIGIFTSKPRSYRSMYENLDVYKNDFDETQDVIKKITGKNPKVLRFPGGSKNSFNLNIHDDMIEYVKRRGVDYYDWNVCDNSKKDVEGIFKNCINNKKNIIVILMHDNGNESMVKALEKIVNYYKEQGYDFYKLDDEALEVKF